VSTSRDPLIWHEEMQEGIPVLVVAGELDASTSPVLLEAARQTMGRHGAGLLIDVSALSVSGAGVVTVFAAIVHAAMQWPDVLVLFCTSAALASLLRSADLVDTRMLFAEAPEARSILLDRVAPVVEDLLPVAGAAHRARDVVSDACLRWAEPTLVGPASLLAGELVTNASVHAGTMMSLRLELRRCHVSIAVTDGSADHAVYRPPSRGETSGRGLQLVDAFSMMWGSTALPAGKVVWSALARPLRTS
jgi:anti-anti-sigma regulatory factor